MIKNIIFIVFVLFLWGCTSQNDTPTINVSRISINGEVQNKYIYDDDKVIELEEGDELELILTLNGNGNDLQTFNMTFNQYDLNTELIYDSQIVTTEGNLTDPLNGRLRFMDGIVKTEIALKSTISNIEYDDEEIIISFYLSSNAGSEGAMQTVVLRIDKN